MKKDQPLFPVDLGLFGLESPLTYLNILPF